MVWRGLVYGQRTDALVHSTVNAAATGLGEISSSALDGALKVLVYRREHSVWRVGGVARGLLLGRWRSRGGSLWLIFEGLMLLRGVFWGVLRGGDVCILGISIGAIGAIGGV